MTSPVRRNPARLSETLTHRLNSYALSAVSAGVGVLALAQPAEAKIVYTKANIPIPLPGILLFDINHDGMNDFSFPHYDTSNAHTAATYVGARKAATGNGIVGQNAALVAGVPVGPKRHFSGGGGMAKYFYYHYNGRTSHGFDGKWANNGKGEKNRYLGVEFLIKGKVHYGWVRLNVAYTPQNRNFSAVITGYAYETIPNRPIVTGKTKGPDVVMPEGSLGRLASGRK